MRCPSITDAGVRLLLFRDNPCHVSAIVTDCEHVKKSIEKEFDYMDGISLIVVRILALNARLTNKESFAVREAFSYPFPHENEQRD